MSLVLILLHFLVTVYSFNIQCSYFTIKWPAIDSVYGCNVQNNLTVLPKGLSIIENVTGSHNNGYKDKNVTAFYSMNKGFNFFPYGLHNKFENLRGIAIKNDKLNEIHQFDLKFFPKLELFEIYFNEIEVLEDHLFAYNQDLKYVNFQGNKIVHIGLQALANLENLSYLRFKDNLCIDIDAENSIDAVKVIKTAKSKCYNPDFNNLQDELTKLDQTKFCASSETFPIFEQNVKDFENRLNKSKLVQPSNMKLRLKMISEWRNQMMTVKNETLNLMHTLQSKIANDMTSASMIESSSMNISSIATTNLDLISKSMKRFSDEFRQTANEIQDSHASSLTLNHNLMALEKVLKVSIKLQRSEMIINNNLKNILDRINKIQTDINHKFATINASISDLTTAVTMKSGSVTSLLGVIKDDILKSLDGIKDSQEQLIQEVTILKNIPKNPVDQLCLSRTEYLEKLLITRKEHGMPDKVKIILMSVYGFFQTIIVVVIYKKFFSDN
ncbi:uncharacterized protein [Chironomus tepperi]|uniref:uncharacterized protein n=1 Tax=Chironomus tepperi TaxID=113505 RepID=UPI00391F1CB7